MPLPCCCSTSDLEFIFWLQTKCHSQFPNSCLLTETCSWHLFCFSTQGITTPLVFKMYLQPEKHTETPTLGLLFSNCRRLNLSTWTFHPFHPHFTHIWAIWLKSELFLRVCLTAQSTQRESVPKTHFFLIWLFVFLPFQFGIFDREPCETNCSLFTGKPVAAF